MGSLPPIEFKVGKIEHRGVGLTETQLAMMGILKNYQDEFIDLKRDSKVFCFVSIWRVPVNETLQDGAIYISPLIADQLGCAEGDTVTLTVHNGMVMRSFGSRS